MDDNTTKPSVNKGDSIQPTEKELKTSGTSLDYIYSRMNSIEEAFNEKYKKLENEIEGKFNKAIGKKEKKILGKINQTLNTTVRNTEDKLNDKIDDSRLKVIETLGIFVALFTFVSVEVPLLKSDISILSATGITLIILGGLLSFILTLIYFLNGKKNLFWSFASVILIVIGIVSVSWDYMGMTKSLSGDFYTKTEINSSLTNKVNQTDFNNFKTCLKNGGWGNCFK